MIYIKSNSKIIIAIGVICVVTIIGLMIYNINTKYPNREVKPVYLGESNDIDNLEVRLKEINVYNSDELLNVLQSMLIPDEYNQIMLNNLSNYNCVMVELEVTNNLEENISFNAMEKFCKYTLEVRDYYNNGDNVLFKSVNSNYDGVIETNTIESIKVPILIHNSYISFEEIKSEEIRLVYSYYPEKCYFVNKDLD